MTTSDDSDKTRFKTTVAEPQTSDDKTRFMPPVSKPQTPAQNVQAPIQKPAGDENKTQIKPARPLVDSNNPDKTRVIVKKPTAPVESGVVSDKTQVIPKKTSATPTKAVVVNPTVSHAGGAEVPADKTRFVAPPKNLQPQEPQDTTKLGASIAKETTTRSDYGILKNRFVFEEVLGAGGMGVVYKAKDLLKIEAKDREPYVAIKVLSDEFKAHPEAFIALQRESRKTQKIAHPNIVTVYDFDRDGDTVFMTMEYMEGKPLDKLINQYRSVGLPTEDVLKILEGISSALMYAHAQNIIHSDFKPGNIFVSNKGVAKVFDFGIARAVAKAEHREESHDDRTVFDAGNLGALTPAYASLEMLEGETPDVRDDIYALGCIAYELFSGEHPYNRMHADEARRQKIKPTKIPGLTRNQWRAIERALAFKREDRCESVDAFWKEFTKKKTHTGKIVFSMVLLIAAVAGGVYYYLPEQVPGFSEDEVRSQIEQKLRIELKMKTLDDLLIAPDFSPTWEAQLWTEIQELRVLLGKDDPWLVQRERDIYALYVQQIEKLIVGKDYTAAQTLTENAHRYAADSARLAEFKIAIEQAIINQKKAEEEDRLRELERQQQQSLVKEEEKKEAVVAAQKHSAYQTALASVDKQLECRANLDMKDFDIAITKLRSLDQARYAKEEPKIVGSLARCIEKIGGSFPERAEEAKKYALRIFKNNAAIMAITIVAKDPCSTSIAGLGARGLGSSCKDKLSGATKAPVMVVVPAKGSLKAFAIGKFEITVDELNEFCQQSGSCSVNTSIDTSLPVTNISLATVNAYLKWLSVKADRKYRLPSLIEWQYAAKAGAGKIDPNRNCKLNSRGIQKGGTLIKASIGQQNAWGLVNYLGNAQELVTDRGGKYLAAGASFETDMQACDFTMQVSHTGSADNLTGFRVLRELQE